MPNKASVFCESGQISDDEVIEIDRYKVPLSEKPCRSLAKCVPSVTLFQVLCLYLIILCITSFSLVAYLKLIGEMIPFCLYDNWFYMTYYLFLCFFMSALIPLSDFDFTPPDRPFWRWTRRLGAYSWFVEWEGLLYFIVFWNSIQYEVEFDDEAQLLVWSMAFFGLMRFAAISIGYWKAVKFLDRVRQRRKLPIDHFGYTQTDIMDILVIHLILMSLYYYVFNIYNILFVVSVSYIYISFARN